MIKNFDNCGRQRNTPGTYSQVDSNLSLILTPETTGRIVFKVEQSPNLDIFRKQLHAFLYMHSEQSLFSSDKPKFPILKDQDNSI